MFGILLPGHSKSVWDLASRIIPKRNPSRSWLVSDSFVLDSHSFILFNELSSFTLASTILTLDKLEFLVVPKLNLQTLGLMTK